MKTCIRSGILILTMFYISGMMLSCQDKLHKGMNIEDEIKVFSKGDKIDSDNFIGEVWVNYLVPSDSVHKVSVGSVTFAPGARTNWHAHQGGQILLITEGKGLYQEKGQSIQIIRPGDVITCQPGTEHWHGATAEDSMTHIAIGTNTNVGGAVWSVPVLDEEYQVAPRE